KLSRMADAAGNRSGVDPGAEINIGPRRTDDGAAGILRDHRAAKTRRGLFARDRQIGFDPERRAVDVDRLVDGDAALAHEIDALCPGRLAVGRKLAYLAEKYERAVHAHDL